jgi:type III secretion protein U
VKTEEPTPRRLREQSKEGTSFRSHDITVFVALSIGVLLLSTVTSLHGVADLFSVIFAKRFQMKSDDIIRLAGVAFFKAVAPVGLGVIAAVVLTSLAQSKGVLATKAISIKFEKLNPVNGLKNLFSMKIILNLLRAVFYSVLTMFYAVWLWKTWGAQIFGVVHMNVASTQATVVQIMVRAVAGLMGCFMPMLVPVAIFEYWLYKKQLRMDKTEVKQEHKDDEGNPEIKRRRKEEIRDLSAQDQADVANSSVILANPTHIAVGIYAPDRTWAPPLVSVLEKGERALAVIALAEKLGIPVVRDKPLARKVYFGSRRYTFVPLEALDGVLRVLDWLADVERAGRQDPEGEDPFNTTPP